MRKTPTMLQGSVIMDQKGLNGFAKRYARSKKVKPKNEKIHGSLPKGFGEEYDSVSPPKLEEFIKPKKIDVRKNFKTPWSSIEAYRKQCERSANMNEFREFKKFKG